ncbi:MarC family protein [Gloeobacter violaceus]|nr:MarC family protein [Gloeobacter violaceus]
MWESVLGSAAGTFLALLPVTDPLGAVPIFYSLTSSGSDSYRRRQARLTTIHVLWLLAGFLLVGKVVLEFFGISFAVLRIAGGLLIAQTGWEMVNSHRHEGDTALAANTSGDIAFAPMAMPLVSGPGAIGVVIGLSSKASGWPDYFGSLVGIALVAGVLYLCLMLGEPLLKRLGRAGTRALNQILGFLILAIALQFMVDGLRELLR